MAPAPPATLPSPHRRHLCTPSATPAPSAPEPNHCAAVIPPLRRTGAPAKQRIGSASTPGTSPNPSSPPSALLRTGLFVEEHRRPTPQPPPANPSHLRHAIAGAESLRRHALAAPVPHSHRKSPQAHRLDACNLSEAFASALVPCRAGISPGRLSGEFPPPLQFLIAGVVQGALTPAHLHRARTDLPGGSATPERPRSDPSANAGPRHAAGPRHQPRYVTPQPFQASVSTPQVPAVLLR